MASPLEHDPSDRRDQASLLPQPAVVITLIHGTGAPKAEWVRPGSFLRAELERAFGSHIAFPSTPFKWSGDNNLYLRKLAGNELATHLQTLGASYPGARQMLVGHSHGGNVALYAVREMPTDAKVAGIACLATPFLHVNMRDEKLLDYETLRAGFYALWCFGVLLILSPLWSWPPWKALLVMVMGLCIGAFFAAWSAGLIAGTIKEWREFTSDLAALFDCHVEPATNLLILRKVGDEASLALGVSQFFSWATRKVFADLSNLNWQRTQLNLRRPLPRAVRALWWLVLAAFIVSFGWTAIFYSTHPDEPEFGGAVYLILLVAVFATVLVKTNQLARYLLAAAFLALAAGASFSSFAFGIDPPRVLGDDKDPIPSGRFGRWAVQMLVALQIEINTEETPAGMWVVHQFEPKDDDIRITSKDLLHSVYNDPRVVDTLVRWVAASTGLRDQRDGSST